MQFSQRVLPKLVLPGVLLAYALWSSVSFLVDASQYQSELPSTAASVIDGNFTAKLDTIYKDRLPYRTASTDLVGAARYLVFGEGRKGVVVGSDGWLFSTEEYRAADDETRRLNEAVRAVAQVRDRLAAMGTALVVLPLPGKADVYREHTDYPTLSDAMALRYDGFRAALAERNVSTVDTRAALLAGKSDQQVFLKGDTHWSPEGAAIVARATALATRSLISPQPFALSTGETIAVDGDLTKFIVSAQYARQVSLAPEPVTLLHASAEQPASSDLDIFGGQPIDVALVGTSYSANEKWSFAASLMGALGADIVNFAEEGHGPFRPMHDYLLSDFAKNSPPKLVIWEFPVRYLTDPDALATITSEGDDEHE